MGRAAERVAQGGTRANAQGLRAHAGRMDDRVRLAVASAQQLLLALGTEAHSMDELIDRYTSTEYMTAHYAHLCSEDVRAVQDKLAEEWMSDA